MATRRTKNLSWVEQSETQYLQYDQLLITNETMLVPAEKSVKLQLEKRLEEERIKEERMHDVLLLLDNLIQREEATVKMVLNSLYDVGSINIINEKIGYRPMNRFLKAIAKLSKPAFCAVAWRWFKGNCPQLITNWLRTKVTF